MVSCHHSSALLAVEVHHQVKWWEAVSLIVVCLEVVDMIIVMSAEYLLVNRLIQEKVHGKLVMMVVGTFQREVVTLLGMVVQEGIGVSTLTCIVQEVLVS